MHFYEKRKTHPTQRVVWREKHVQVNNTFESGRDIRGITSRWGWVTNPYLPPLTLHISQFAELPDFLRRAWPNVRLPVTWPRVALHSTLPLVNVTITSSNIDITFIDNNITKYNMLWNFMSNFPDKTKHIWVCLRCATYSIFYYRIFVLQPQCMYKPNMLISIQFSFLTDWIFWNDIKCYVLVQTWLAKFASSWYQKYSRNNKV